MMFFFFKQKTAYEICWSSDVCSSDLEIDPRAGESVGQLCKLGRRATEWLERRAEQGSPAGARELPEPRDAEERATQRGEQLVRPLEAGDQDPGLERDVTEQKVQELRQVPAHRTRVERDHGAGATAAERVDRLDASGEVQIGRAHVRTPVTVKSRMPSSA